MKASLVNILLQIFPGEKILKHKRRDALYTAVYYSVDFLSTEMATA